MTAKPDGIPYSESDPSDGGTSATDAPRAGGKPLGNVALAGTFFPPNGTKTGTDLTIQHTVQKARMVRQVTFLHYREWPLSIFLGFADTLDVNLFRFAEFTAVVALSNGTTFLFDLEQWAVGVFA